MHKCCISDISFAVSFVNTLQPAKKRKTKADKAEESAKLLASQEALMQAAHTEMYGTDAIVTDNSAE
jgi:hypothetical protein